MRSILFIALCYVFSGIVQAQNGSAFFKFVPNITEATPEWAKQMYSENPNVGEVEDAFKAFFHNKRFVKSIHTQNHKHWIRQVAPLLDEDGYIHLPTRAEEDVIALDLTQGYQQRNNEVRIAGAQAEWVSMGPFETFKQNTSQAISWHKNIYAFDQSLSSSNVLICGTEAGGVYKSTDKGANWTLISKGEVFAGGTGAVKIHPTNSSNFLIATNKRIYQSVDGGQTWIERYFTDGGGNEFQYAPSNHNIIFHTNSEGLFKSVDGGVTWTQVYTEKCWDIDFHPTNPSIAYLLKTNVAAKRSEFFRSSDGGATWSLKDTGWYVPFDLANASDGGGKIAVSPATPNMVYVCLIGASKSNDDGWIGVYRSDSLGDLWGNPSGQDGNPYGSINGSSVWNVAAYSSGYHQGYYNFDFEASAITPGKLWIATIRLTESADSGQTFLSIGGANTTRLSDMHADIQGIEVIGSDVWVVTDGGVNYSNDELMSHVALNRGIQAGHFWGFNTGWNEDTYTGGKYHDGTSGWFENYGNGNVYNIGGVEEASGYVHPIESRKLLYRTHYSSSNTSVKTIPETFGGQIFNHPSYPIRPNESYSTAERSGVYFDPRYANHIYVGLANQVHKSTDGGITFNVIYTFPNANGEVYEMEISRSNPNVIYAVYNSLGGYWDPCEVWKSTDGGLTWAATAASPSGNRRRFRISVHPEDENTVWLCTPRGNSGNRVHSTTDGGATWTNRTTSVIDGDDVMDIMYQGGTNDIVYVISSNSVYYWDAVSSDWIDYGLGLPLVSKAFQINPFYRDGELKMASNGRGIWARSMADTLFYPISQPITYADSIFCSRDTAQFDCYSILKHDGATWAWSFSPAPAYISSNTDRDPKIVFGADGNYDVSLTITDAQGNTSTKTIPNMVTVISDCEADSVAGNALSIQSNGDFFISPNMGLSNVTHFTTTAWIKPDGSQNGFAGIVSNGEWCAHCNTPIGLIFDYYGNELYYRWPNGASWGGGSGMTVPLNEWSYVAMVVSPDSIVLYLNDEKWVSNVILSPVDIPALVVGKGHYSEYMKGDIDEVTIWDRALSQSEIRELRHLTKKDILSNQANLVSYYQFNRQSGNTVLDNGGLRHGGLVGTASLKPSTAPVGPGVSERLTVNTNTVHTLPNVGLEIDFGSSNPLGEIVVTRLNVQPDSLPNGNPGVENYWIVNNYANSSFGILDTIKFDAINTTATGSPANAHLFVRSDNEHLNNWSALGGAVDLIGGSYNYDNATNITSFSQFFIQSGNANVIAKTFVYNNVSDTICDNETVFLEGGNQNTAGIYRDTTALSPLRDSVVVTTLVVNATSSSTDVQSACGSYTWIDGNTYMSSNNSATHTLTNSQGCDSLITLDLTISSVTASVSQAGIVLIANPSGAIYQWLDCNTNSPITGEVAQDFTPLSSGIYAVIITQNNCTDTSSCITFTMIGVGEAGLSKVLIYPNPSQGIFKIDFAAAFTDAEIRVFDERGRLVVEKSQNGRQVVDFDLETASGKYFIFIQGQSATEVHSIVVEE